MIYELVNICQLVESIKRRNIKFSNGFFRVDIERQIQDLVDITLERELMVSNP